MTESFVHKELSKLNPHKGTGLDLMPARFLKDASEFIKTPLTYIVNLSIKSNTFPTDMKQARITPLFKKNSKFNVGNYRPVSVLSVCSKVLEKAVNKQLYEYLSSNNILFEFQSGFRSSYSTDTCLIYLQDYIRSQTAKGNYTGMILLDIQKAFDCVDHNLLCRKLEAMGLKSAAWFRSYLHNREQKVIVNGIESSKCKLVCGVPQGSILGPLLFLCYMNDMPNSIKIPLFQYADDSALLYSSKNLSDIETVLTCNINECYDWLVDNKLSMHPGKTELILFGSKSKLKKVKNYKIECQGHVIYATNCVKYLGVLLNQTLSGEEIVTSVMKKVHAKISFLYRQASFFDLKTKKMLCAALVLPHFDYSICSWYTSLNKYHQKKLQVAQNKIVRFILNYHPRTHLIQNDFCLTGLLSMQDRAQQLRLNHMYAVYNKTCPQYMLNLFTRLSDMYQIETRGNACNFYIPKVNTVSIKAFYYTGVKDWNNLPLYINLCQIKLVSKKL